VVTLLQKPGRNEHPAAPYADVAETHSACVFFVGDRAYKLKKQVNLGFVDFTTLESRTAACARELELNRRFAPDVYVGIAEVRDAAGDICEHLLVMRRMPADRRLSTLIGAQAHVDDQLRTVARMLAAQHASAPRGPEIAQQGGTAALSRRWQDNIDQTRPYGARLEIAATIDETQHLADRFLGGRGPLFDARIRAGRVVDGHGDLLADDVFCLDDGPRILDCLDFDERLRWLDGLDDASFLAMDLERLGAPELADRFSAWYMEYSADAAPAALRHHYIAYRAFVRAKVSCLHWDQGHRAAGEQARMLAGLALGHLRAGAVTLVVVGGQPGAGKSSLAGELAGRLGFTVLSSDRIRKELAGISPDQPAPAAYGAGIYTASWTERTYGELLRRAAQLLSLGESVIADASWTSSRHRAAATATASRADADLVPLCCTAPAEVAARRIHGRRRDISDANEDIARELAAAWEPWPEAISIDTSDGGRAASSAGSGSSVAQALAAIRPHGAGHSTHLGRPAMEPD
jgi:aminoglycoside phosphotransferase family enzyme/predicted kinase